METTKKKWLKIFQAQFSNLGWSLYWAGFNLFRISALSTILSLGPMSFENYGAAFAGGFPLGIGDLFTSNDPGVKYLRGLGWGEGEAKLVNFSANQGQVAFGYIRVSFTSPVCQAALWAAEKVEPIAGFCEKWTDEDHILSRKKAFRGQYPNEKRIAQFRAFHQNDQRLTVGEFIEVGKGAYHVLGAFKDPAGFVMTNSKGMQRNQRLPPCRIITTNRIHTPPPRGSGGPGSGCLHRGPVCSISSSLLNTCKKPTEKIKPRFFGKLDHTKTYLVVPLHFYNPSTQKGAVLGHVFYEIKYDLTFNIEGSPQKRPPLLVKKIQKISNHLNERIEQGKARKKISNSLQLFCCSLFSFFIAFFFAPERGHLKFGFVFILLITLSYIFWG